VAQASDIDETKGEGGRRISRRSLIKGSAVVGATVWAAPVVESFTSKAFAGSVFHYCCACADPAPGQTGVLPNEAESDQHPPSVADCVTYCNGSIPSAQSTKYTEFIWCGPSHVAFTSGAGPDYYSGNANDYGCFINGSPDAGCTSGTITYNSSGAYAGYTVSSTSASGTFG
jgi:hypothetical protein